MRTIPRGLDSEQTDHRDPSDLESMPKRRVGWIVAGSLMLGLVVGLLLAIAPFTPAEESRTSGALLSGFAVGWAALALFSTRVTDQPQRWAAAPALFMGVGGLLLLSFGSAVQSVLSWIWPPTLLVLVIWMFVRARAQMRGGSRWMLLPVFAALLLASVGGIYETVSAATDAGPYPMTGQLIDVGGRSLHLRCSGSGSPTVVLQPGAGGTSSDLGWIEPAVARDTQVCVYDRAGRGWSEPADTAQDAAQIATELHALLDRGQVPGPYVLVGHSFGGLYVLTFAALYPDDVAGMVLVDSTAPASTGTREATSASQEGSGLLRHISALVASSARFGVGRMLAQSDYGGLPEQSRDEARAHTATASQLRSIIDEYLVASASIDQAASLVDFAEKPLIVLTAGIGSNAAWMTSQDRLATLSPNSAHRVIDGANHGALLHDEQGAAATTQAILDLLSSIRNDESPG